MRIHTSFNLILQTFPHQPLFPHHYTTITIINTSKLRCSRPTGTGLSCSVSWSTWQKDANLPRASISRLVARPTWSFTSNPFHQLSATMSPSPLPTLRRIVTTHNTQGQSTVAVDSELASQPLPHGAGSVTIWSSEASPADVASSDDKALSDTGFVNGGSIFRIVDLPPHSVGALHRSISLDYIIVQKGSVVLTLEDGSRTRLQQGEFVVQQATMHGWDNETGEWARMLAVMLPAEAPVVDGKELQTDLSRLI